VKWLGRVFISLLPYNPLSYLPRPIVPTVSKKYATETILIGGIYELQLTGTHLKVGNSKLSEVNELHLIIGRPKMLNVNKLK